MELDTFIERSNKTSRLDELVQLFCEALQHYGYSNYVCFYVDGPHPDMVALPDGKTHYNAELLQQYEKLRYVNIDPVYALLLCSRGPFTWDAVWTLPLSRQQKAAMYLREQMGLVKGFSIPIKSHDNDLIGISLGSTHADARTDKGALAELYALANQFCLRRDELRCKKPFSLPNDDIAATLRPAPSLHLIVPRESP